VRYLRERVLPNIESRSDTGGRERKSIELSSSIFVVPTDDPKGSGVRVGNREQVSFYASTPPYRPVFDLEGWGEVADRLKRLAARGEWNANAQPHH
jgi:hypothetical protein